MTSSTNLGTCQINVLLALLDGWTLQLVDGRGWRLFAPGRPRPFANVKLAVVDQLTEADWVTPTIADAGDELRLAKALTPLGREVAAAIDREDRARAHNGLNRVELKPEEAFRPEFARDNMLSRAA